MTKQQQFVLTFYDDAVKTQVEFGVPLLVTLAQAALESGWGKNAPGNNFFGVKAFASWQGKKQLQWTTEFKAGKRTKVQAWFRAYDTAYESFKDHAETLKKRFPVAFTYKKNPDEFIRSVQRDHHPYKYATDPLYTEKIISIIRMIRSIIADLKLNNVKEKEG